MKKFQVKYNKKEYTKIIDKVRIKIKKYGFCILKEFNSEKTHGKIYNQIKKRYKTGSDIKYTGEHFLKSKDFQRLDIGNSFQNARFMRVISFFEWNKRNKKIFELIKPIIKIRNDLSKIEKKENCYPNVKTISKKNNKNKIHADFVRMIQYPLGGGFLQEHSDYTKHYAKEVFGLIVPITFNFTNKNTKSKKYQAYKIGGLYYKFKNKNILTDDFTSVGDLIFFDPKTKHGVKSIQPYSPLNLNKLNGRVTLAFSVSNFKKEIN
jgi:hypothetical protein